MSWRAGGCQWLRVHIVPPAVGSGPTRPASRTRTCSRPPRARLYTPPCRRTSCPRAHARRVLTPPRHLCNHRCHHRLRRRSLRTWRRSLRMRRPRNGGSTHNRRHRRRTSLRVTVLRARRRHRHTPPCRSPPLPRSHCRSRLLRQQDTRRWTGCTNPAPISSTTRAQPAVARSSSRRLCGRRRPLSQRSLSHRSLRRPRRLRRCPGPFTRTSTRASRRSCTSRTHSCRRSRRHTHM